MTTAVSADFERHVSCLVVAIEFYPQMAIKMIQDSPDTVLKMIEKDPNNKFMNSLNKLEKDLIPTLSTGGFNELDMPLLYKLIRHFNLVLKPSKKWGKKPLATNVNDGDDMERMRNNLNHVVHRPKVSLSENERDTFFKESIEIACRMDQRNGDSTSRFETKIRNAKMYSITQDQSRQALEKCPKLQEQLKNIHLYYGEDIVVILRHQDLPAADSTRYTIYIRGRNINDPAIREKLKQVKKILNEGSYSIRLLKTESGSLVLHVEIKSICFRTKDSLHKEIAEFLQRVFTSINGSLEQHIMTVVLAECDSYIISDNEEENDQEPSQHVDDNEEENDDYLNDQEPLVLKLGAMVMTSQHVDEAAACTALLDDKDARATQEDKTFGISTSSPLHGTSHEKNPEEACGSNVESEKGSNEEKIRTPRKNFIKKEKKLILHYYVSRSHECTLDTLMEIIYEHRKDELPSDIVEHYENLYEQNKLKDRIKHFIEKVHSGRRNETDPDIMALMKKVRCNPFIQLR